MNGVRLVGIGLALLASAAALTPHADAQPKKPAAKPKPKVVVDAGADEPKPPEGAADDVPNGTGAAAGSGAGVGDGGISATAPVPSAARAAEGGPKASPLNPAPAELPDVLPDAGAPTVNYDKLLGDIATLRARVAAVGDTLFHARLHVAVATDSDRSRIERLTVAVDDGVVYVAPASFRPDGMTPIYAHAVAPGRHAITLDVDRRDVKSDAFRTAQRSRFTVDVPRDAQLDVEVKILDDSTMGSDFPGDHSGRYDLRVRVKANARAIKR